MFRSNSASFQKTLTKLSGSKDAFDRLYVQITQDAIDCYVEGKRRKWALKLHGDLAAFDL
jgi:trafficking protein particle complex subunit 10